MAAALSWTNQVLADTDGVPSLTPSTNMTATPTFDAAFPGTNALNPDPSLVARANFTRNGSSPGDLIWRIKWSGAANDRGVRLVAAINCRIPSTCTQVACDLLAFGDTSLAALTTLLTAAWVPIPGTADRYHLFWLHSSEVQCAGIELDFRLNASASGNVEIGYLWAGPALIMDIGIERDLRIGHVDQSPRARGRSGGFAATRLPTRRRLQARILPQQFSVAMGNPAAVTAASMRSVIAQIGASAPCVFLPDDSSTHRMQLYGMYGAFADVPELGGIGGGYFDAPVVFEEIR